MSSGSGRIGGDNKKRGEGVEWGEGDPRALLVVNLVLSTVPAAAVVYGLSYIDLVAFSVVSVASTALVLAAVTYLVTN